MKHYKLLQPYLIERQWHIVAGFISLLIVDILQLFIPRIIKWSIDSITLTSATTTELFTYALYIVASAIFISIFRFCWRYLIMGTARRVEEGLRGELFNHIQTLPASFFDLHTAGDIMAHATNDMVNIRMALGMGIVGLTDTIVLGCAAIFFMSYIHLELTLLALLPMPFIIFFTTIFSKKLFDAYVDVQAGFSDLMESTRERFAGIRIIKAFNREAFEVKAIKKDSRAFVSKNMNLVKLRGLIFPVVIFLTNISLAIILGIGGRKVILSQISPGDFVAFISYLGLLTWPVMAVGWVTNLIQRGAASLDRINAILESMGELDLHSNKESTIKFFKDKNIAATKEDSNLDSIVFAKELHANEPKLIQGDIEFTSLSFSYPEKIADNIKSNKKYLEHSGVNGLKKISGSSGLIDKSPEAEVGRLATLKKVKILNDISFKLEQGKMLGIAGSPGSGKTTLANLIPRIYEPDTGSIKIGGVDIRSIPIQALRKSISFMPQEPFLFSGTIKENLLFGDQNAGSEQIQRVLKMAQLTETIDSFPKGIETIIGEKGVMLSGGQKQRIALARTFLKSAPIMILDDPVSQVDMQTASSIIKIIESFAGEKTIIIVSHRFSIFKRADHTIVLDKGYIIEQGTHMELVEKNGYYKRAWQMQESEDHFTEDVTSSCLSNDNIKANFTKSIRKNSLKQGDTEERQI